MAKATEVDESTFNKVVLEAKNPVLVDFWASWCVPCRMVAPIIEELAGEYAGRVSMVKLNVDQGPKLAGKYSIRSIPTLLLFNNGKPVRQVVGLRSKKELKGMLDEVLLQP